MTNRWEGPTKIKHFWRPCVFIGNINGIFNWCWLQLMVTFWVISISGVAKNSKERNLITASPGKRDLAEVLPPLLNSGSNLFCNVNCPQSTYSCSHQAQRWPPNPKMLRTIPLSFNYLFTFWAVVIPQRVWVQGQLRTLTRQAELAVPRTLAMWFRITWIFWDAAPQTHKWVRPSLTGVRGG